MLDRKEEILVQSKWDSLLAGHDGMALRAVARGTSHL